MKNVIYLSLSVLLFMACQQGPTRYTQNSPEIDTVKTLIANYNAKTYDTGLYADTSKTYYNTKENPMTPSETMEYHQQNDPNYSNRGFLDEDQEYEMVVTDDGETWVNCWLDWKATMAANDKEVQIPIHLTYQFVDGKIVREIGHWDPTEVVMTLQEIEAVKNMSVEEKAVKATIDAVVKAWNSNDKGAMAAAMIPNFVRTENGNVLAKNAAEYGTKLMDVYHSGFPDFKVAVDKTHIAGNKAYLNWTCTGTNTANFQGNPATNKPITTHGFSVWTFDEEGKATREDAYYDNLTVFSQLGYSLPALE